MNDLDNDEDLACIHPKVKGIAQDEFPMGTTRLGEVTVHRTPTIFRRSLLSEAGPRHFEMRPIDYIKPDQVFKNLYAVVAQIIKDCGACSRSDLTIIPALSRYSAFQIERALLTAEHHGLLRKVGTVPKTHPDAPKGEDPDEPVPHIYDVDDRGLIDRSSGDATVRRAIASRYPVETAWLRIR